MSGNPFDQFDAAQNPFDQFDPGVSGLKKPEVGGFSAAAKQVVGSTIKGVGQLGADYLPGVTQDNALTRYGQGVIEANPTRVQGFQDIIDNPWTTVKEAVGNALPSVGGALGLRAAGQGITALTPLAGPAAPIVAGLGQAVSWGGPIVAAGLPSYGSIREEQLKAGNDGAADKALALGGSAAVGAIEMAGGPQVRALKALTGGLKREAGESIYKAVGKEALKSGLEEGAEELVQSPIEQAASYKNPLTAENLQETAFGGAMGFIGGGVLGGGMQLAGGQKEVPPEAVEVQRQALAKATGGDVEIVDGVATITDGENTVTAPVEVLTKHFVEGKTLDTFDTAAATAPKLNALRTAVQDDNDPFTFDTLVALSKDTEALKQAGVNRKDVEALVEAEIERGVLPEAAWIKQERAARKTNQEIKDRIQGITARVSNVEQNRLMDEQVRQYEESLQVPETPALIERRRQEALIEAERQRQETFLAGGEAPVGAGIPVTEQNSILSQAPEWSNRYADLLSVFGDRQTEKFSQEPATPTPAAITRLTELEQKAQGLPGVTTPTSLSPQEEQEYVTLRAQVSPADAQRLQEYQANVARRDELALKQAGAPAFETVGEGGVATVVPERAGQTLTPKEQVELAQLVEVTRQPPVSPYVDDSRTLAAGLPAAQSETLFSQRPPWETGPVQTKEEIAPIVQQVNPNVRYDGAMLDLHNFTIALPDGRQPSFTVRGEVTPQTFTEALNATEARFGVPLTETLLAQGGQDGQVQGRRQTQVSEGAAQPLNAPALRTTLDTTFGKGTVNRLTRQGKLQIVATAAEIPGVGPLSIGQQMRAQGVYRSREGKIYLVADNLSKSTVTGVFKHEVVHALLRQDQTFMQRREALLKDFAKLIGKDASVDAAAAKVPAGTAESVRTEEILAYWVQNEANHKHSLFRRMVAAVKAALRRLGIPTTSMTPADFSRLFAQGTEAFVGNAPQTRTVGGTVKALYSQVAEMFGPKWRSRLAEAVQSKGSTQSASNWLKTLETWEKKGTIPAPVQEELEWSGLKEYLQGLGDQKIARMDIVNYLSENGVKVQEVVKGEAKMEPQFFIAYVNGPTIGSGYRTVEEARADLSSEFAGRTDLEVRAGEGERAEVDTNQTKFSSYQLPGGQNYKELLLVLPPSAQPRMSFEEYWKRTLEPRVGSIESAPENIVASARKDWEKYGNTPRGEQGYRSSHFDEPNILAHVRFNERVDAEGNKVLFIEEVQSDWGQDKRAGKDVPNAPLIGSTQSWSILAMKRMIRYAAENGFDKIAWTTGEQQAERYDLSKQVDKIYYSPYDDGTFEVTATLKNGAEIPGTAGKMGQQKIADTFGKEVADKIAAGVSTGKEDGTSYLSGLDLKVGGEGMKAFYDKMLPSSVGKFIKQFGGKVEAVSFGDRTDAYFVRQDPEGFSVVLKTNGNVLKTFASQADAEKVAAGWNVSIGKAREKNKTIAVNDQPGFTLTPAMRESALGEGMPLFSQQDADTLFSQASTAHQQARSAATASLKEMAKEKLTEMSPFFLRVSPLRTLVQTLGTKIPQIAKISAAFDEMNHTNTSMVEDAKGNYDDHQRLNKKATGSNDKFNLAATTATFYRMTPWKNLDEQEWIPANAGQSRGSKLAAAEVRWKAAGMDKSTGKTFIAAWNEAAKAYREIGSKEAQDQYRKMARHMRHIRQREETNVLATIESATVGNPVLRASMMERFNATFKNIAGTYWPLTREGEYILQYKDADGLQVVEHFLTAQARRQARQLLEQGGATEIQQGYASKTPRGQVAIPGELMQQFSQAIVAERTKGLDPEQDAAAYQAAAQGAQETINDLNQIWLRWQPETAALKNAIQRRNVKGYDLNAGRAYLEYVQRHAQSIAWTEQGKVIEGHLKDLQDKIKEDRKAGKNVDLPQMVLNDLRERVQAARDSHVGPIASLIGKLGTAYYMTSPSIALVQMTQLPMLTLPKLGAMYNAPGRAVNALRRGITQAFSKKFNREAMYASEEVNALFDMTRHVVTEANRGEAGAAGKALGQRVHDDAKIAELFNRLTKDQQKLFILRESLARNLLDISATHEAYAIAQGKDPDSLWRKAFDLAMTPMRVSEQASRKAAILATMEMAQAQGKGYNEIMADVSEVVNDTLYSYDKTNKPVFLQGSTGRVLAMFQWYRIMTIFRMALLFKRSIRAETPEIRAAAQKEFLGIMGMAGALAGTIGMPMAGLIFAALDAGADDDEPRDSALEWRNILQEQFGERLGEIAAYGLPAAVGLHLTKRVGMGDMFGMQSQPPPNVYGKDLAAWWAANQLGPAFSIGQGLVQGYDEIVNKGNIMRGLEAAVPKPIKDMMKAYRVWDEGELKTAGGKRLLGPDQITPDMIPLIALGFNPLEAAKVNEANYSRAKLGAQMSRRRGRVMNDVAEALQGDGDLDDARQALIDFNRKNPAFVIRGGDIRTAIIRSIKTGLGVPSKREAALNTVYGIPAAGQ